MYDYILRLADSTNIVADRFWMSVPAVLNIEMRAHPFCLNIELLSPDPLWAEASLFNVRLRGIISFSADFRPAIGTGLADVHTFGWGQRHLAASDVSGPHWTRYQSTRPTSAHRMTLTSCCLTRMRRTDVIAANEGRYPNDRSII